MTLSPEAHEMLEYIRAENVASCRRMLAEGLRPDGDANYHGGTFLTHSITFGALEICDLLMDSGASLTSNGASRPDPFLEAARFGKAAVCRSLIARGVDWKVSRSSDGKPALTLAAIGGYTEVCRLLVGLGADVHEVDLEGITALHYAAVGPPEQTLDVCRVLVEAGADSSIQPAASPAGYLTPLQEAVRTRGRAAIVSYLITERGEDPAQRTADGKPMLKIAGDETIKEVLRAAKTERSVAKMLERVTPDDPVAPVQPNFGAL